MASEYKTDKENFEELLIKAREMDKQDIELALRDRLAYHGWAVRAYEQALSEKQLGTKGE